MHIKDPRLVDVLKRLCAGQIEAEDWLEWWGKNGDWASEQLNRGEWLRLKPRQPGRYGPASRCALVSQKEAFKLLNHWGIEFEPSTRYEDEWKNDFERLSAESNRTKVERREQFRSHLDRLMATFPELARFLKGELDEIELLGEPASDGQIQQLEHSLRSSLPQSYRSFLACTNALVYGDRIRIGLPYTFRHPDVSGLTSVGRICFGEYWLEGDGDQVLFGAAETGAEPPVLYYNHSNGTVRVLADSFTEWVETLRLQSSEDTFTLL